MSGRIEKWLLAAQRLPEVRGAAGGWGGERIGQGKRGDSRR